MEKSLWLPQYEAAHRQSAFFKRSDRSFIACEGKDRVSFLQGMVTNDVKKLEAGTWLSAALLDPRGRILADLILYNMGDSIWLETESVCVSTVVETLRKYKLAADISLTPLGDQVSFISLMGADARRVATAVQAVLPKLGEVKPFELGASRAFVAAVGFPYAEHFDFIIDRSNGESLQNTLLTSGSEAGSEEAWEALRIEAGMPRYGIDAGAENLLLEIPFWARGISYTKGCYIGQETVARLHARGENVAWKLRGVALSEGNGSLSAGANIHFEDKEVGKVTSTTFSPKLQASLGLAMIHREAQRSGTIVEVVFGITSHRGTILELPIPATEAN